MSLSLVSSLAHLGVDLVEPGVDHVLLRRQVGRDLLMDLGGCRAELLALQDGALLECCRHRGVTLGRCLLAHLGDRVVDGRVDGAPHLGGGEELLVGELRRPVGRHGHGPAGRDQIGDTGRRRGEKDAQQHRDDQHSFMMRMGV